MKRRLLSMLMALVAIMTPIGAWAAIWERSVEIKIPECGFSTFYYSYPSYEIPEGISASIITELKLDEDGMVTEIVEQPVENYIPAGCAVILRGQQGTYSFYQVEESEQPYSENLLKGTDEETTFAEEGFIYFTLDVSLMDWKYAGSNVTNGAHKASLALPIEEYPELAEMLETLENPHLQHTHGGCEICGQLTGVEAIEAAWGTSADDLIEGTLEDAIFNAGEEGSNIGYIKLLADVESVEGIYVNGGNFTLDLNGYTISSESYTLYIQNNSKVTIVDNSETKSGKVISSGEDYFAVGITNSASVTIEEGTYESTHLYALNLEGNSSVTISGGSYNTAHRPVQIGEGCSATITGGTFTSTSSYAINNNGTLNIAGGTFTSEEHYTLCTKGTLTIDGGEFSAGENFAVLEYSDGTINLSEYEQITTISVKNTSGNDIVPGEETILLPEGYCFYKGEKNVTELANNESYTIGEAPTIEDAEAAWGASSDDLTTQGTLEDAIAAAGEEGSTVGYIQLQEDVETGVVINGGTFTLDLNGHTIGASNESHGLQIQGADTHVTLKGETEGSMVFANNRSSPAVNVIDGASVTIESGTYTNYYNIAVNNETDCSVTIIDGVFESTSSNAIANCGDLVIKGGTFTSSDGLSTIRYSNGAINLSEYENITNISISSWIDPSFTPSAATILLPEGYCFFDSEGDPVGAIMYALDYSIGEEPDTKYTITFAANGGGHEMADGISYGKYSLPECTFTAPDGMMFKAWQIGEEEYQPGNVVTIEGNTTITAVWASLFEVSFEANGGTGSMDDIFTIADCTLPECTFTAPDGMMFKAWQIGEDEYQPGDDVTIEANTTITAVWTAYVPQIIIKMHDSAGDGWHGDAIVVKKNGKEIGIATIEDGGADGIVRYNYDNTADYTFYWQYTERDGRWPNECFFEIFIDGEDVFVAERDEDEGTYDCENYEDGELIYSIEHTACPHTSFNNGVCAECGVMGGYCGAETNEGGVESVRWAISEDGSILTILGEGAMADYKGNSNNPWWRKYCQKITTIVISDGISRIGNDAFGDLDGITDIVIPSSVTTIGSNAFYGCASLNTVTLNKGLRVIEGNAFVQCKELTTITIPDGVTEIGVNAFNYCSSLGSINIPHSVTTIGQSAFTANISTVYVSCSPQFEYTFGTNTTVVYAEHDYEDGFCTVCGKIDGCIHDGEHESFYVEENIENVDITYTRTLPNLMWNALYVPFEIPVSALEDNYDVAYVNDVHSFDTDDDGEIDDLQMEIIKITSGTLKANYPYLIRAKNEGAQNMELILDDATLCATEGNTVTCSSVFMQFDVTGTYDTMSQDGDLDILAISTDGSWKKLAEGTALKPFRLYLTLTAIDGSPVKVEEEALTRMRIVIRGEEGNETGIDQITTSHDKQTTTYFDLSGRRVKTPVKGGLYIVNGKKVVY